jgi:cysteine desulfurase
MLPWQRAIDVCVCDRALRQMKGSIETLRTPGHQMLGAIHSLRCFRSLVGRVPTRAARAFATSTSGEYARPFPTNNLPPTTGFAVQNSATSTAAASGDSQASSSGFSVRGSFAEGRPSYLDMQATTPMDPRVLDAMLPFLTEQYGNPHSRTHSFGWEAEAAVEKAREQVASLIGADPREVIFTSGATESNNIAIKGIARFVRSKRMHVVTSQIEHKCVLDSCRWLESEGFQVTYVPVLKNGLVDMDALKQAIRPGETSLVSVMGVNNEIGAVQPLKEIAAMAHEAGAKFHTDVAQMVGKMPFDVNEVGCDAVSISGHKIYGPKGVGALYVRRRPRLRLEPQMSGGGQERGLRSGTLPHPLIVGLGAAAAIAQKEMARDKEHVEGLSKRLVDGIRSQLTHVHLNGDEDLSKRYAGCTNLSFECVEGESLLMALKNIAVSSGSACTSASLEPSYVLRALGVNDELAHTSIRFGMGRFTTMEEVDFAVDLCVKHVTRLREMSPLWEMVQAGIDLKTIQWTQEH